MNPLEALEIPATCPKLLPGLSEVELDALATRLGVASGPLLGR